MTWYGFKLRLMDYNSGTVDPEVVGEIRGQAQRTWNRGIIAEQEAICSTRNLERSFKPSYPRTNSSN